MNNEEVTWARSPHGPSWTSWFLVSSMWPLFVNNPHRAFSGFTASDVASTPALCGTAAEPGVALRCHACSLFYLVLLPAPSSQRWSSSWVTDGVTPTWTGSRARSTGSRSWRELGPRAGGSAPSTTASRCPQGGALLLAFLFWFPIGFVFHPSALKMPSLMLAKGCWYLSSTANQITTFPSLPPDAMQFGPKYIYRTRTVQPGSTFECTHWTHR